jgi:hypothetical protein
MRTYPERTVNLCAKHKADRIRQDLRKWNADLGFPRLPASILEPGQRLFVDRSQKDLDEKRAPVHRVFVCC